MDNSDARGDLSNASAAMGVITDGSGVTASPVEPSSAATPTSPPELARFFNSDSFSDLVIRFGSDTIRAHKVILCSHSSWFIKACEGGFKESTENAIELRDDDPRALSGMIRFCYGLDPMTTAASPGTSADVRHIIELYACADKYQVPLLATLVENRFQALAAQYWLDLWDQGLPDIVNAIYSCTTHPDNYMRRAVVDLTAQNAKDFRANQPVRFKQVLDSIPDFATELVMRMAEGNATGSTSKNSSQNEPWKIPHKTPLHWAAQTGDVQTCRELIARGYPVDCLDENGETPLHFATWYGSLDTTRFLVESGARVNATSHNYPLSTPLRWATDRGHHEIISYLQAQEAAQIRQT